MFKLITTLFRGQAARMEEDLADRNALLILEQQMRDAASAAERAKRALAIAMAQDATERERLSAVCKRIADLETRAIAALQAGDEKLASEAAESIAELEADRDAAQASVDRFAKESFHLKQVMKSNDRRLAELERGRRAAAAAEAVARLRSHGMFSATPGPGALREAEDTLERLRLKQREESFADAAREELDSASAASVSSRLEAAGYGPATKSTAASVLQRLRQNAQNAA